MYQNTFDAMAFELFLDSRKPHDDLFWEDVAALLLKTYACDANAREGVLIGHIKGLAVLDDSPGVFIKISCVHPDLPSQIDRSALHGKSKRLSLVINALHSGLNHETANLILSKSLGKICGCYDVTQTKILP